MRTELREAEKDPEEREWRAIILSGIQRPSFAPADPKCRPDLAQALDETSSPVSHSSRSVLVVEDDHGLRRQLTYLLEDEGYTVEAVGTGSDALAISAERRFDIVILDVRLPDIS